MLLGKSILFPIDDAGTDPRDPQNELRNRDTLTLLTMAGVAGFISNLMLRRSYTSWAQYWCFLLAVACIGGKAAIDSLNGRRRKDDKAYKLLQESSELRSMDSEETAVSERSDDTRVADISGRRSNIVLRGLFVSAVVPFFWSAWAVLNFSDRVHQKIVRATTTLDAGYSATTPAELVISMYKEPIDDVAHLINSLKAMPHLADADVHIYIKDSESDTEAIQQRTGATNITTLPNIGREGETYLYHILQNWNTLAAHTVFLQADVHNPREFYPRIRDYFDPQRTGFLSLGWAGQVCNCEDCGDRWSWQDTTHLFPQIHSRINDNATACDKVLLSFKGQFVASAKRIRGVDTSVYQDLREAFVNKESWAHKEEYLQGRPDSMSAPVFGYTMERMWNLLFQCNDMDVAWKCPTLLSGTRGGGSIEDCQCFDPVDLASER
ncbi:hypothetical protein BU26DRAFT_439200 [Trematosphaeria pertusa]|uniref:Uncharacterized protein n=1 Tax=Trematosphaeria pertusa TaxID=390896 RepID=A0A6A6HVG4_9PLEO|nr:uncharacterized protein BU26DRAFT_439200 [Trematosphaeria pertusa]KAF2242011.1 hypothetical protein BU26DRAFT_439200 [Trematosphaeria pertusa]